MKSREVVRLNGHHCGRGYSLRPMPFTYAVTVHNITKILFGRNGQQKSILVSDFYKMICRVNRRLCTLWCVKHK